MSEELELMDKRRRGEIAKELLGNEVWQEAFNSLRTALVEKWEKTRDAGERDEIWRYYKLTEKLRAVFTSIVRDGENAELSLRHLEERKSFARDMMDKMMRTKVNV